MTIDVAKEELYREAARRINEKVAEYSKVTKFDIQDRLAMAAFFYSIEEFAAKRSYDADLEEMQALEERIRGYVKR